MSQTLTITGTVTDSAGATGSFAVEVTTVDAMNVTATVTPISAPAGTSRLLVTTASGGTTPYSFATPVGAGLTFTPVTGSPGSWTFVF